MSNQSTPKDKNKYLILITEIILSTVIEQMIIKRVTFLKWLFIY